MKTEKKTGSNGDGLGNLSLNLKVKKVTLDNGLRVLVYEDHRLPVVSYYTFFDVGGRYEEKGVTGATHFLEHMMFKGSKNFKQGVFDSAIEASGGHTNAYTTFDSTVYYDSISKSLLPDLIKMEADRLANLAIEPGSFEKERKVVFEERKMRYENNPMGKLYLKMMQAVFKGTPYGLSVIGSNEDLKALTRENLYKFYKKYYTPNNAIVLVAGDVDSDDVINKISKHYGDIPKSLTIKEEKKKLDTAERFAFKAKFGQTYKINGTSPVPVFMFAYKGKPTGTRESQVMDLLGAIIGSGESSYLYQRYVNGKRPRLSRVGASNRTMRNNGVFFLHGTLLKKTNLRRFKKELFKDRKKICGKAVTDRALSKAKNQFLLGYYKAIQTNSGVASFLGSNENFMGSYDFYKQELAVYDQITAEEVRSACKKIFSSDEHIFISLWDKHPSKKK
jgi:zinc protease